MLQALSEEHGIKTKIVESMSADGEMISSTRIRQYLLSGDVMKAGEAAGAAL
jgi:FAD synthase